MHETIDPHLNDKWNIKFTGGNGNMHKSIGFATVSGKATDEATGAAQYRNITRTAEKIKH